MLKNKTLLLIAFLIGSTPVLADELVEVTHPKAPAYRLGISAYPERQFVQAQQSRNVKIEKKYAQIDNAVVDNFADRTYADLSIKNLSKEIAQDLEFDEQNMVADLSLLWQGAAQQSDTINFALYKLANPDADKPDEKSVKNVLKTIASMSTIVGASMGNPLLAGSSLLGGNLFGIMSQDTKALNYKYTRVNDADMIILIRKIEDLQQNAVNLYYDYISARKNLDMMNDLVEDRQRKFELAQKNNAQRELVVITDAYYRTALDKQRTAKAEFFAKRAALEQFVGTETFLQFESEYIAREKGENISKNAEINSSQNEANQSDNPEYIETIKAVENFKDNLESSSKETEFESKNSIVENIPAEELDKNLQKLPALRPLEEIDFEDKEAVTGFAANFHFSEEFRRAIGHVDKNAEKERKQAGKEQKRIEKQLKKEQKKADKILAKQAKMDEKVKKESEKQLKEQQKKDENLQTIPEKKSKKEIKQAKREQKKIEKQIEKQSKKDKKALKKMQKSEEELAEQMQETPVTEKKSRAQRREEKKEEKRLAKEKAKQEKEAKKNKDPLKGMIFLHGQDKSLYRHHHYFSEKPAQVPVVDNKTKKKNKNKTTNDVITSKDTSQTSEIQAQVVNEEILPSIPAVQSRKTPADLMGLPPLEEIRVPELRRGGYSIHSEY